jgi:dipeptide transport system permease protein
LFVFIIRRLFFLPLVLIGVSLMIVGLMQLLSPTQRAAAFVTSEAQLQNIDLIIRQYGLDQPFYVQYYNWMSQAVRGNLGFSRTSRQPVMTTIRNRLPVSAELALFAFIPIIGFGVWMGTLAALNRDKAIDQFTRVTSIVGISLPAFVLGIWLLVIFYGYLGWFPPGRMSTSTLQEIASGRFTQYTRFMTIDSVLNGRWDVLLESFRYLVLPVITLTVVSSAQIMRVMRSALLDVLSQDYVRTARAKGLNNSVVNMKHARRNALIPIVTLSALVFIFLLNGVVITETIFNYPGLGRWAAESAVALDYPGIMGFAAITGVIVVIGNLAADVLYAVVDPRIRY